VRIEEIPQEEPQFSSPIHLRGTHIYQAHPFPYPHTLVQAPLSGSFPFNSLLSFLRQSSLGQLTMIEYDMVSQPIPTIMTKIAQVATSSMFVTSVETHLNGGPSIPLGYQSLFGTFFDATSNPWTSPTSSSFEIPSITSLMSATWFPLSPPPTPIIE